MSKGLEALKETAMQIVEMLYGKEEPLRNNKINELLETKRFKIIEKELKALEIIKKRFTIQFIKSDFLPNYYGIMQIGTNPIYIKTKEEFDLLKEVFK